ncbi:MAG: 4Fe-4S binding protein [Candidatus Caldatribacteriota bacterium]|nr:4Fe-4S binding protein [Candidatus Caldatribacteriota bacterium]
MAKIIIDEEKCKGCELCTVACPENIIVMAKHFNKKGYHPAEQINPEKCTGCAFCALTCPDLAIEVYK